MSYFMSYDTENESGRHVYMSSDEWEGAGAEANERAGGLHALRARLYREGDQEPPTRDLLAVFSLEFGRWIQLRQDYRPGWERLSPEAKEALRENPSAVHARFLPELTRTGFMPTATQVGHWEDDGTGEWSPSPEVQAFVWAMPPVDGHLM